MNTYAYTLLHNTSTWLDRDRPFMSGCLPGDLLVEGTHGQVEATSFKGAAEVVFMIHNRDDRPDGKTAYSMSVGDAVVLANPDESKVAKAFSCETLGSHAVEDVEELADAVGVL